MPHTDVIKAVSHTDTTGQGRVVANSKAPLGGDLLSIVVSGCWPLVGRGDELHRLGALLGGQTRGLVLAGPPGVGKTRLASEFLALAKATGVAVLRVTATRAGAAATVALSS